MSESHDHEVTIDSSHVEAEEVSSPVVNDTEATQPSSPASAEEHIPSSTIVEEVEATTDVSSTTTVAAAAEPVVDAVVGTIKEEESVPSVQSTTSAPPPPLPDTSSSESVEPPASISVPATATATATNATTTTTTDHNSHSHDVENKESVVEKEDDQNVWKSIDDETAAAYVAKAEEEVKPSPANTTATVENAVDSQPSSSSSSSSSPPPSSSSPAAAAAVENKDIDSSDKNASPRVTAHEHKRKSKRKDRLSIHLAEGDLMKPDCGFPGENEQPHLSLKIAKDMANANRMKKANEDGSYEYYPYDIDLGGFYPFPPQEIELAQYGLGILFYFKILKALGIAFAIMTVITLPTLVIFTQSNALSESDALYMGVMNSQTTLATATIASLREPMPVCRDAEDGEKFEFKCPESFRIDSIVAYYGKPKGACACPYEMQTDVYGNCPGRGKIVKVVTNTSNVITKAKYWQCEKTLISPSATDDGDDGDDSYYSYSYDDYDDQGTSLYETKPCFAGNTRFGNSCCSYSSDNGLVGIFDDLKPALNPECNSYSAPFIASALCKGRNNCQFTVDSTASFSLPLRDIPATADRDLLCSSYDSDSGNCITTLSYNALFTDCVSEAYFYDVSPTLNYYEGYPDYFVAQNSTQSSVDATKNLIFEAICVADDIEVGDYTYSPNFIVSVAQSLNGIAIIVYIITVCWIQKAVDIESDETEGNMCTAADYTVLCTTLPHPRFDLATCTESPDVDMVKMRQEILDFFHEKLKLPLPNAKPNVNATEDSTPTEPLEIFDIQFTTSYSSYIRSAVHRGKAASKVDVIENRIRSRIQRGKWTGEAKTDLKLIRSLKKALFNFTTANDHCLLESEPASKSVHGAFITFATEEGYLKCMNMFPDRGYFMNVFFQKEAYKWKDDRGKHHHVAVTRAPEPSEVIWENFAVPSWSRLLRGMLTLIFTIGLLGVSYAMIYQASVLSDKFVAKNALIECSSYQVSYVPCSDDGEVDLSKGYYPKCFVPTSTYSDTLSHSNQSINIITYADVLQDLNPLFYNVTQSDFGSYGYIKCYCQEVLLHYDGNPTRMQNYMFYDLVDDSFHPYCKSMTSGSAIATAANYIATFIIVVVNMNLQYLLKAFTTFERLGTKTDKVMSLTIKLFVAQYINTAMLSLIISGDLTKAGAPNLIVGSGGWITFGIFTGNINDFNTSWYYTVGASLMFTMFMFTLGKYPSVLVGVVLEKMKRYIDRFDTTRIFSCSFKKEYTHKELQSDLNDLYAGPEVPVEDMYATILTVIFVDLTYSPAMPLMNIITAINIGAIYLMDKFLVLRHYRRPPFLNTSMPKLVIKVLYWAAVIHIGMGIWMFGNNAFSQIPPSISTTTTIVDVELTSSTTQEFLVTDHDWNAPVDWIDRIFGRNSIFLFAILCALMVHLVSNGLYQFFDFFGLGLLISLTVNYCNNFCDCIKAIEKYSMGFLSVPKFEEEAEGNPPFFEAIPIAKIQERLTQDLLTPEMKAKYLSRLIQLEEELEAKDSAAIGSEEDDSADDDHDDDDEAEGGRRSSFFSTIAGAIDPADSAALKSERDGNGIGNADESRQHKNSYKGIENNGKVCCSKYPTTTCKSAQECKPPTPPTCKDGKCIPAVGDDGCTPGRSDNGCIPIPIPIPSSQNNNTTSTSARHLMGDESYAMDTSIQYSQKFGLHCRHIARVLPQDWIVKNSGVHGLIDNDSKVDPMIAEIIASCQPYRNKHGKIPNSHKISMATLGFIPSCLLPRQPSSSSSSDIVQGGDENEPMVEMSNQYEKRSPTGQRGSVLFMDAPISMRKNPV